MLLSRDEVLQIRDTVRDYRSHDISYEDIAFIMNFKNGMVEALAYDLDFIQSDSGNEMEEAINALIQENPKPLQDYRGGKKTAIGALMGMIKKKHNHFDSKELQKMLVEKL